MTLKAETGVMRSQVKGADCLPTLIKEVKDFSLESVEGVQSLISDFWPLELLREEISVDFLLKISCLFSL